MAELQSNPCGWSGSIKGFLSLPKSDWLTALKEHHQRCMNCPADESQILAWDHSFDILQIELKKFVQSKPAAGNFTIIFEYELPRERGRRPDVIILGSSTIYVFEFKDYAKILQAHVDQVDAYARDLKHYHAGSRPYTVLPILVLARTKDLIQSYDQISIVSANSLGTFLANQPFSDTAPLIEPVPWIVSDYSPLPSLIQAARTIWNKQSLPQIKRALSAGIPQTIAELIRIAQVAQAKNELHLALVTGVPGAGKTLVGIQLVYENHLDTLAQSPAVYPVGPALAQQIPQQAVADSGVSTYGRQQRDHDNTSRNIAVFLSGNGPLVKVLQHALKNSIFVQDVHGFLKQYGGSKSVLPHEHIWVYDEAQRAWDAERVNEKRGHPTSEPEDFLKLAERMNSWALMVALIGEGQEIHIGEDFRNEIFYSSKF